MPLSLALQALLSLARFPSTPAASLLPRWRLVAGAGRHRLPLARSPDAGYCSRIVDFLSLSLAPSALSRSPTLPVMASSYQTAT